MYKERYIASDLVTLEQHQLTDFESIRGCTYSTHCEVLVLVLGVEPEPNLVVVLKQLGSVCLVVDLCTNSMCGSVCSVSSNKEIRAIDRTQIEPECVLFSNQPF